MPDPESRAEELVARVQELVDAKPDEAEHPLEWAVPAHFLGDMSALAIVTLRAAGGEGGCASAREPGAIGGRAPRAKRAARSRPAAEGRP